MDPLSIAVQPTLNFFATNAFISIDKRLQFSYIASPQETLSVH